MIGVIQFNPESLLKPVFLSSPLNSFSSFKDVHILIQRICDYVT